MKITPLRGVRLESLLLPRRSLSAADRRQVEAALGRFAVVEDVVLHCGDTDFFTISGFFLGPNGAPDTTHKAVTVLDIENGRLLRID